MLPYGSEIKARLQNFIEDQLQTTMVYDNSTCFCESIVHNVCLADKVYNFFCSHFIIQWTGVLIGAAVAVSLISIVTFFMHRIYKAGECVIFYDLECFYL